MREPLLTMSNTKSVWDGNDEPAWSHHLKLIPPTDQRSSSAVMPIAVPHSRDWKDMWPRARSAQAIANVYPAIATESVAEHLRARVIYRAGLTLAHPSDAPRPRLRESELT